MLIYIERKMCPHCSGSSIYYSLAAAVSERPSAAAAEPVSRVSYPLSVIHHSHKRGRRELRQQHGGRELVFHLVFPFPSSPDQTFKEIPPHLAKP